MPDDENITSNYDLRTNSDLSSLVIKGTVGIVMETEPVKATEQPMTIEQSTNTEQPMISEQLMTTEQPTTALITSNMPIRIEDSTTKQVSPSVKLIQTTISSIDTEVEPIQLCLYDERTGVITNTSGDCYESCDNGKYLNVFFNENNILYCCCK